MYSLVIFNVVCDFASLFSISGNQVKNQQFKIELWR